MKKIELTKRNIGSTLILLVKIIVALFIASPIIIAILFSIKPENEIAQANLELFTRNPTFEHFNWVLEYVPIFRYLLNTLVNCVIIISSQVLFSSFAAYALAFFNFKLKKAFFTFVLCTMMIPAEIVIITNYISIQRWGLTDTYLGLSLPYMISAVSIFLMRQFYMSLPKDLKDASVIDGCSDMKFFFRIAFPISVPFVASLAIYDFIIIYNRYFWPLLVTNRQKMRTIQIGMALLIGGEVGNTGHVIAGAVLSIVPAVIVFAIGQKYLIKGMTAGAIKG